MKSLRCLTWLLMLAFIFTLASCGRYPPGPNIHRASQYNGHVIYRSPAYNHRNIRRYEEPRYDNRAFRRPPIRQDNWHNRSLERPQHRRPVINRPPVRHDKRNGNHHIGSPPQKKSVIHRKPNRHEQQKIKRRVEQRHQKKEIRKGTLRQDGRKQNQKQAEKGRSIKRQQETKRNTYLFPHQDKPETHKESK